LLGLLLLLLFSAGAAIWVQDVVDGSDHAASLTPPAHVQVPAVTAGTSMAKTSGGAVGNLAGTTTAPQQPEGGFDVSGDATSLLYPGGAASPIELVFHNPGGSPLTVTGVTVSVDGTSAPRCSADNFEIARQLSATPLVPAGSTRSLSDLGVPTSQWPAIQMVASGNQDACSTSTVNLSYSGTGRS
jgi:hypothetical protein